MSAGITELTTFLVEDPVVGSCSPALGPEFAKAEVQSAAVCKIVSLDKLHFQLR